MKIAFAIAAAAAAGLTSAQPVSFIDLGVIGGEGDYSFDTDGSTNDFGGADTELAIYSSAGIVLDENDDNSAQGGPGGLWSLININLDAGVYYLATGEFDSIWEDNFINSGSGFEGGDDATVLMNINGVNAGQAFQGIDNQNQFWRVEVVPAPASAALLGLGGLVATRRRR